MSNFDSHLDYYQQQQGEEFNSKTGTEHLDMNCLIQDRCFVTPIFSWVASCESW